VKPLAAESIGVGWGRCFKSGGPGEDRREIVVSPEPLC
jgi:hypothetical protein